ncbi:MAG: glutamate--tRNA ligase [Alphaproteobacteria bacterium]|nr:glutamate--tRNA ligase [Alphaproteobacteria bacterium]MDE2042833.1 glutamate--tRNA ligase [Alphaproteobacteria bacterium]
MSASPSPARIVTRFAPSPTGFLHIGGARTALFNWLYAKHTGGTFLLRIEDTDHERSTQPAIAAILDGLSWLGIDWDGDTVFQSQRAARHAEVAHSLLAAGQAYRCYATPEELEAMRAAQRAEKLPIRYDGRWRARTPTPEEATRLSVIRLKAPQNGTMSISDQVQGAVKVNCAELDDFVLLRSDGTPTYMLAVVVDDYDMGITHIIRGDDHLNNAFRQLALIKAMGWPEPVYAHVPLIHGADGAKLSKRHGALGVDAYRDALGFLPEAVNNYLLRLGWGHGNDEIISRAQAIDWFDIAQVGRAPSRFDFKKLENLNGHYLREADDVRLVALVRPRLEAHFGRKFVDTDLRLLSVAMPHLKARAKSLIELADAAYFLFAERSLTYDNAARALLNPDSLKLLDKLNIALTAITEWTVASLDVAVRQVAEDAGLGLGKIAQPLRAALTGRTVSPGIFEVLELLGRSETLARIEDAIRLAQSGEQKKG